MKIRQLLLLTWCLCAVSAWEEIDANDVAKDLVTTQCRHVEEIDTIQIKLKVEKWFGGKLLDSHRITWGKSPTQEIYHFEEKNGELLGSLSGLRFSVGNRSYYNGPDGYIGLQNFDGQLIEGVLPPDSPCSARIASRQERIRLEDPYVLLLLQLIPDEGIAGSSLLDVAKKCKSMKAASPKNINFEVGRKTFDLEFDPEHNGLVRELRKSADGKTIMKSKVESFENVPHFGPFPTRVLTTIVTPSGAEAEIRSVVEFCRINEEIDKDFFDLALPNEVPLFNASTGQIGYWESGSARYFKSEAEALQWQKTKSIRVASKNEAQKSRFTYPLVYGTLLLCVVIGLYYFRRSRDSA